MTQSIDLAIHTASHRGRGGRLVAAIIAALVILAVLSFVELGALAVLAVVSSAMNHGARS